MGSPNFAPLTLSERLSLADGLALPEPYRCKLCDAIYYNRFKFSAHYQTHRGIPDDLYVRIGPKSSKRVMRLLKARRLGIENPPLKKRGRKPKPKPRARTLSPQPTRAFSPPSYSNGPDPRAQPRFLFPDPDEAVFPAISFRTNPFRLTDLAGSSSSASSVSGPRRIPGVTDYASWMANFSKAGWIGRSRASIQDAPSPRAGGVGPVVDRLEEADMAAALGPPPGFEHVIPDLNFPLPSY